MAQQTSYGENDGPLGMAPDIDVGFSDAVLLAVSFVGFCMLAASVYSIVLAKLKTAEELQAEEEAREISYDERLARADVSTLNRAQRRARAKHIMKRQRRLGEPQNQQQPLDPELLEQEQQLQLEQQQDEDVPEFREDSHLHTGQQGLSRRERQRAAKKVELRERRLLEGTRREEQHRAQAAATARKKERERLRAEEAERRKHERAARKTAGEREAYRAWKIFLEAPKPPPNATDDDDDNNNTSGMPTTAITVREWISELREHRIAYPKDLADRFRLDEAVVIDRIRELLDDSRLSGILENGVPVGDDDHDSGGGGDNKTRARFIYLSPEDMSELGSFVKSRDVMITPRDLARRIEDQVRPPERSPAAE